MQPGKLYVIRYKTSSCRVCQCVAISTSHKTELSKEFVKALNHDAESFQELRVLFLKLSEAKVKGNILTGPQVKKMLN